MIYLLDFGFPFSGHHGSPFSNLRAPNGIDVKSDDNLFKLICGTCPHDGCVGATIAHLRNPFGPNVVERRPIVDGVAGEEHVRLHNKHIIRDTTHWNSIQLAPLHANSFV